MDERMKKRKIVEHGEKRTLLNRHQRIIILKTSLFSEELF